VEESEFDLGLLFTAITPTNFEDLGIFYRCKTSIWAITETLMSTKPYIVAETVRHQERACDIKRGHVAESQRMSNCRPGVKC